MGAARQTIQESIRALEGLPSIPHLLEDILGLIAEDDSVDIEQLVDKLELDPGLCARILKLVNSAYYGFPRRVDSLRRAVVLLGFNNIQQIALGATVVRLFQGRAGEGFDPASIWRHSVHCGSYAAILGMRLGVGDRDGLFVGGLLHDVGKFFLWERFPGEYQSVLSETPAGDVERLEAERRAFGLDHAQVGAEIAAAWSFPVRLVDMIRHHHRPPEPGDHAEPGDLLFVSNALSHLVEGNSLAELDPRAARSVVRWGLGATELDQIRTDAGRRSEGAIQALEVA